MSVFGQLRDQYGFAAECTPLDCLKVTEVYRLVGATFWDGTLDTTFWTPTVANSGTVTVVNGEAQVRTNTTASGSAILQSTRIARYVTSNSNFYRANIRHTVVGTANNVRRWGAFSATSGAFFELNGTTLNIVTRSASSDTAVATASWNVKPSYVMDTNCHTYEIYMTNRKVHFVIDGALVHTVTASTAPWTDAISLPVRCENTNTGITTDITVQIRTNTISRFGPALANPIGVLVAAGVTAQVLKRGPGVLQRIVQNNHANGGSITLYDSLTATNAFFSFSPPNGLIVGNIEFNMPFNAGLTVTTVGDAYTCIFE